MRKRLQERRVPCPLNCLICDHDVEDDWHVLLACDSSVQAQQSLGLDQVIPLYMPTSQTEKQLVQAICKYEDNETAGLFAMMVWILWNNRNNSVWNDLKEDGRNLGIKTRYMWEDWIAAQSIRHSPSHAEQQHQVLQWQKPPQGWYKCNVDAGFYNNLNRTSAGWCLRNQFESFQLAGTYWNEGQCTITEGESLALLEAMREMEHRGFTHVIFETDSKNVVDVIQSRSD